MGRKGNWFSSVKKAFSPGSKDKKAKKESKSQKQLFEKENPSVSDSSAQEIIVEASTNNPNPNPLPTPLVEDAKFTEVEDEQAKPVAATATTTIAAAETAVAVIRRTQFGGKSKEEVSAIKIQTAFRGHLARRALRALRGLVRLKTLVDGPTVKRQTANTLKCMQTLSRVQSQIQSRRLRMLEENHALQRQLLQKRAKELESLRMGEEWDDSVRSKEQVEANLLHKYEAAMRRERALAYSYTHQQTWKKSTRSPNLLFMDPTNPHWGWSWLERWMSVHPWENQTAPEKDHPNAPLKSSSTNNREIAKPFARHQLNSETNNPSSPMSVKNNSPLTTPSKSSARKAKPPSPRVNSVASQDDDSSSVFSVQSERINRRHSVAGGGGGSVVRDDESLASSPSIPGYMTPTRSAKAKSKLPSPLGAQNGNNSDKGSSNSATKKRLSYPPSPARARRHSMPPKVETSVVAVEGDVNGVAC